MESKCQDDARHQLLVIGGCGLAYLLLGSLFGLGRFGPLDFFWSLSICTAVLGGWALSDGRLRHRIKEDIASGLAWKLLVGVASAGLLYLLFSGGKYLLSVLWHGSSGGIRAVYALGSDASEARIAVQLFVVAASEELFWRGMLLGRFLEGNNHPAEALAVAAMLYTVVHVASVNPVLVLAAAVCGVFWSALYVWFRSPVVNITSHVAWDISVFVLWPFV